jgi:transcriptional regulator with XRE-family HTH domain
MEREGITGGQIRAARALLDMSAQELAGLTKLSRGTIQRAELETAQVTTSNLERIVEVLEERGVMFIPADRDGPGVRLRRRP